MSDKAEVYVLFGQSGEYSDHSEWVVGAYVNKADADADCEHLNRLATEARDEAYELDTAADDWWDRREAIVERLKQHDADLSEWPAYFVASVPLFASRRVVSGRSNE